MTSVRKSPNMMSTTGRMPVIAAPSPMPVIPASEMGESSTRSGPNSSTRPESTLNGVPASATSSPTTNTAGSRRSSSASASLTACASEISRVPSATAGPALGVDMPLDLAGIGEGRREGVLDRAFDLLADLALDALQGVPLDGRLAGQPAAEDRERIALAGPGRLLLLRPVVHAVDVSHVVAVEAIRAADEEGRAAACPRALDG